MDNNETGTNNAGVGTADVTATTATELTQEQQDQEMVNALEARVVEDAANLSTDQGSLTAAQEKLSTDQENPVVAETVVPEVPVENPVVVRVDALDEVIDNGIRQYDGYPDQAHKVAGLRELKIGAAGMSLESRNLLAETIVKAWA